MPACAARDCQCQRPTPHRECWARHSRSGGRSLRRPQAAPRASRALHRGAPTTPSPVRSYTTEAEQKGGARGGAQARRAGVALRGPSSTMQPSVPSCAACVLERLTLPRGAPPTRAPSREEETAIECA